MSSTTSWSTPALVAGVLVARQAAVGSACTVPVTLPAAAPAPAYGARVPSARLPALFGGMPFGIGAAADERHLDIQSKNTTPLGLPSPSRPLS